MSNWSIKGSSLQCRLDGFLVEIECPGQSLVLGPLLAGFKVSVLVEPKDVPTRSANCVRVKLEGGHADGQIRDVPMPVGRRITITECTKRRHWVPRVYVATPRSDVAAGAVIYAFDPTERALATAVGESLHV